MKKRSRPLADPESTERREIVKGGLLAAAAALGFLPSCSSEEPANAAAGSGNNPELAGNSAAGGASRAGANAAGMLGRSTGSASGRGAAAVGGGGSGGSTARAGAPAGSGTAGANVASAGSTAGTLAAAGGAGVAPLSSILPRALLGKTGVSIPILGLGTSRLGERGGNPQGKDWDLMLQVFQAAIDMGIEYIDTGANYGRAEEAIGQLAPKQRDKVFLVTKLMTDTRAQAQTLFERSLSRMKVDHVDVLHLHSTGERNIDTVLSQNGAWSYIMEQKQMGRARFVGITGHNNPPNFLRMLATDQVDVLMTIMNFVDHSTYGLSKAVREDAVSRGVGVMAMKVFGGTESILRPGQGLANTAAPEPHPSNMQLAFDVNVLPDCMRFVKGLGGVTGMVVGINSMEELGQTIRWAIETQPFTPTEMDAVIKLGQTVAPKWADRYG